MCAPVYGGSIRKRQDAKAAVACTFQLYDCRQCYDPGYIMQNYNPGEKTQNRRPRDGDSASDQSSILLRYRSSLNAGSAERADPVYASGNIISVTTIGPNDHDHIDVVNTFLVPAFQSPRATPNNQDTPSTLPSVQSSFYDTSVSKDQPCGYETPVRRGVMNEIVQPELDRIPIVQLVHAPASCNSPLQSKAELKRPVAAARSNLFSPILQASTLSLQVSIDDPSDSDVKAVQDIIESPCLSCHDPQDRCVGFQTPAGGASAPIKSVHSLTGKTLQYSPKLIVSSATPIPPTALKHCVPCHCPEPLPDMSLENYRRMYPNGVYVGSNLGNGSVPYQRNFFKNAIHEGWPLESLKVDLASSQKDRKKRLADHEDKKLFNNGQGKRSGRQKDAEVIEFEEIDTQIRSTHHPQYCLQVNNFLPRLHELRNNFINMSVLRQHVCPTDPSSHNDVIDEAIPQLLLLPSLPDSWAIALLVQFTTARNPLSSDQTGGCLMDLANQDFGNRSGNHIMKSEMPFGATFEGVPLPAECFTNHTFPQLCDVCP
jgi:hypothetical protein